MVACPSPVVPMLPFRTWTLGGGVGDTEVEEVFPCAHDDGGLHGRKGETTPPLWHGIDDRWDQHQEGGGPRTGLFQEQRDDDSEEYIPPAPA